VRQPAGTVAALLALAVDHVPEATPVADVVAVTVDAVLAS